MAAACTNPAALGRRQRRAARLSRDDGRTITGTTTPKPWVTPEQPIDTPWVSVPGLLTAQVRVERERVGLSRGDGATAIRPIRASTTSSATSAAGAKVLANWGLHLIDVNLAMGNLVDIVGQQAKSFAAKK